MFLPGYGFSLSTGGDFGTGNPIGASSLKMEVRPCQLTLALSQ